MRLLTFPFFVLQLATRLLATIVGAAIFQASSQKLFVVNALLTFVALTLLGLLIFLPPAGKPATPALNISLEQSSVNPLYISVQTSELPALLQQYEYLALQQPFVPQYRYVNLAILAAAAHQPDLALNFLKLARYIDPNQEIFSVKN